MHPVAIIPLSDHCKFMEHVFNIYQIIYIVLGEMSKNVVIAEQEENNEHCPEDINDKLSELNR